MFEIKALKEEYGEVAQQLKAIAQRAKSENRVFTDEENAQFDLYKNKEQELRSQIATAEKLESVDKLYQPELRSTKLASNHVTDRDRDLAFRAACLRNVGHPVPHKWTEAQQRVGYDLAGGSFTVQLRSNPDMEYRDNQTIGTTTEGGYLTNTTFSGALEKALKWYGPMRQVSRVIRTENGSSINWPTMDETGNAAAVKAELGATTSTDLVFGQKVLGAYKTTTACFMVSMELMQDSLIPVETIVAEALGERISRYQNTAATVGTGSGQPEGVVVASSLGKTAADDTTVTALEIIDLIHSVDKAYRNSPNFGLMMHDSVYAYLLKLQDDNLRPLWLPNYVQGGPSTFLGVPVHINNDMTSTMTANAKIILAGDFSKGILREVADTTVLVARERHIEYAAIGFYAFARYDYKLINTAAVKHLKLASA